MGYCTIFQELTTSFFGGDLVLMGISLVKALFRDVKRAGIEKTERVSSVSEIS